MGVFKRNPFGHILFLKKMLIRIIGVLTHRRFRGFNELQIEGSDIIKKLPNRNVLFRLPFCEKLYQNNLIFLLVKNNSLMLYPKLGSQF